ncbi:NADH:flavin oxidoreductase [Pseudoalteromonas mariniglutinosa]|uniref:NADH:flavin oxidoreductase n=1 Tax=Pseudoalteromonas mariniglutinosa TaxID=206042 RepID=UPI00384B219D
MSVFKTYTALNKSLENRFAVAPMTRVSADKDGTIGEKVCEYYTAYSRGGFGLIITEGLYTDKEYSQGYLHQPGIITPEQVESWKPAVRCIHNNGAVVIAQLMHAGALSQFNQYKSETAGPSSVKPMGSKMPFYYGQGEFSVPKTLSVSEINSVINGFVQSAINAKEAGFDGVEVHAANGYLLDQFFTDYTNTRTDQYGGNLENRTRLIKEIIGAIRIAVGNDFIVGIRFSQKKVNDTEHFWAEAEKLAEIAFTAAEDAGADYIHTTDPVANQGAFNNDSLPLAQLAKKYTDLTVIANGSIDSKELANEIINAGIADLVAIGKTALANQDMPKKLQEGRSLNSFDFAMLAPIANLECAEQFLRQNHQ